MKSTTTEQNGFWHDWADLLLGVWLLISPFVLGFNLGSSAMWNNVCVGAAVIGLAWISGMGFAPLRGATICLSAWVFFSPFVLGFPHPAFLWTNVGTAFLLITGTAMSAGSEPTNYAQNLTR